MKKILLILSALAIGTLSYAQRPTHFIVDYNPANHVNGAPDCISGYGGTGGTAFGGGNVNAVNYISTGSPNALQFIGKPTGQTIDPVVTPYYMFVMQLNPLTSVCEEMSAKDSIINIKASGKVKVTAKAAAAGVKFQFFVGYSNHKSWPGVGTYNFTSLLDTITLTTSYQTYTVDWLGRPDWTRATVGPDSVNIWGIRMLSLTDSIYIQKVEFGTTAITGIKTPTLTNAISVYPNPSAGKVTLNTHNRAGNISIMNPLGAIVQTIAVTSDKDSYDVNLNNKGLYFLNFVTEEGSGIEKLVIE
ncbi:MAG TPA: T9SS type A sorting domain-containing protein [Cytophagaceae bacterium]|jgi:hypothetical protein|nr:T9SS type A sorting domain-containing protein [Cytophagaceae bacterium]